MSVTLSMFQGRHAYVNQFYDLVSGDFVPVAPWDELERQGKPPVIVHAQERNGKCYLTKDVKAGGVYDPCSYLTGALSDEQVGFDILHQFAKWLGWAQAFDRECLIYHGGRNPLRPGLMTGCSLQPFSHQWDGEFWEKQLLKKGLEAWATGLGVQVEWTDEAAKGQLSLPVMRRIG